MKRERALQTIKDLPIEFDLEALIEKLIFIDKVEKGLKQVEEGKTVPHGKFEISPLVKSLSGIIKLPEEDNKRKIVLNIPEGANLSEPELKIILAGSLYEKERLSLCQAAELTGLSKRALIEVLGLYGYSIFSKSEDDLLSDVENS